MPKRNPIQDVQIKNGWIWSRNTGPVVFLINADARNIISTQATFITRYEDSDKKPVRYLYITAYKLNMEKIGLTSRLGKVNIMMLKRANFFSASPKTSIKSKQTGMVSVWSGRRVSSWNLSSLQSWWGRWWIWRWGWWKMFYYAEQCLRIVMCEQQLDRRWKRIFEVSKSCMWWINIV